MKFHKHLSAIHVEHHKNTAELPTEKMPVPDKLYISMVQHIGAPCQPIVSVGDYVKVGQMIGNSDAFVSAPIHTGASGTVTAIENIMTSMGVYPVVTIETDKKQELFEGVVAPTITDKDSFLKAVRNSGLVGLGGAAFPTHVKYNPKNLDEVDTLVLNGAECEPYITSDYRTMLEDSDLLINGVKAIMQNLGIKRAVIGIENNKPEAIRKLKELTKDASQIEILELRSLYPQGAEKVLIYEATGRMVPPGKLPADVGTIVSNVASVVALEKYLETGMPLVSKKLTVDGNVVKTPKNLEVLIGTKIFEVMEYCGGYTATPAKILMGGPMMGRAIYDDEFSIIKNNNAILAFDREWSTQAKETACINCGRCMQACPLNLVPTALAKAYKKKNLEELKKLQVMICMECGSCTYVCPAKKPLSFTNKLAKLFVQEGGKK
ncbi:MAG: electron transport complex subunit RsxC [Eubacteriales bacterium]|nr:electron transport complex subunit RsxC [Eubacteriales bacterium]MDD3350593.1 electron transport complex subunit RsxC [Eubacteriales bacterium]